MSSIQLHGDDFLSTHSITWTMGPYKIHVKLNNLPDDIEDVGMPGEDSPDAANITATVKAYKEDTLVYEHEIDYPSYNDFADQLGSTAESGDPYLVIRGMAVKEDMHHPTLDFIDFAIDMAKFVDFEPARYSAQTKEEFRRELFGIRSYIEASVNPPAAGAGEDVEEEGKPFSP